MPGRKYEAQSGYRYGFNGKEKDKDLNSLTAYDYGFRIYNPGIGKFLSVDPLTKDYPSWSPYPFAMNRVIDGVDIDGLEYINSSESKISIYINLLTFNKKSVIYGKVSLNYDKVSTATQNYILSWKPSSNEIGTDAATIASFKHDEYQSLVDQQTAALSVLLKQPTIEDIGTTNSIKQPEIEILKKPTKLPVIAKDAGERYNRSPNRASKLNGGTTKNQTQEYQPSGVGTGTAKGDAIIAMITLAGDYLNSRGLARIDNDFRTGNEQLSAVPKVLSTVQFAVDNNLISNNLSAYANYLLDGRAPTFTGTYTNKSGEVEAREYTDTRLLKKFQEISDKIYQLRNKTNN